MNKQSIDLVCRTKNIDAAITLDGSKSISNRVLIIKALCANDFEIENLSTSDDTQTLSRLLSEDALTLDCGHAGTTYRFLTAYLAFRQGDQILTGSDRMQQRPIGPLVDVLRSLGANIEYQGQDGFPPLLIKTASQNDLTEISIPGNTSSQYISALLMLAPTLANGLTIKIQEELVSQPYVQMTLDIMAHFGVSAEWVNDLEIKIPAQAYQAKDFRVESDWSAASYYYTIAAFAENAKITLSTLYQDSLQGDAEIAQICEKFGIHTAFGEEEITITKSGALQVDFADHNLIRTPDIAQTLSVMHAGIGSTVNFSGLKTLKIKETDRVAALKNELAKVDVFLSLLPSRFSEKSKEENYLQQGLANISEKAIFDTYHDHRMAMAFAPLAMLGKITINDPAVVSKSYPKFWDDMKRLGFEIN